MEDDLRPHLTPVAVTHLKIRSALRFPVNGRLPVLIRFRIDLHAVRHHKGRVESESKVPDDLVFARLVLIFFKKISSAGKRDAVNVFLHLVRRHTESVIDKSNRFLLGIDEYLDLLLVIIRKRRLSHHVQLFQLRYRIAAVTHKLADKNVVVRIEPFFNDRKYILRIDCQTTLFFVHLFPLFCAANMYQSPAGLWQAAHRHKLSPNTIYHIS